MAQRKQDAGGTKNRAPPSARRPSSGRWPTPCAAAWTPPSTSTSSSARSSSSTSRTPFEEQHARLVADQKSGADPEDPDEYRALSIFWVPPAGRWAHLKAQARQPIVGQLVDDAMAGIERDNPALKGVLPTDYARPALDKTRLGQLIELISNIKVGGEASRANDVLGRVSIDGQESNYTTWRLAKMNLAIRGIDGQIAHGDTLHDDRLFRES